MMVTPPFRRKRVPTIDVQGLVSGYAGPRSPDQTRQTPSSSFIDESPQHSRQIPPYMLTPHSSIVFSALCTHENHCRDMKWRGLAPGNSRQFIDEFLIYDWVSDTVFIHTLSTETVYSRTCKRHLPVQIPIPNSNRI